MIISSLAMCRISNYELTIKFSSAGWFKYHFVAKPEDFLVSRPNYYLVLTYGLLLKKKQLKFVCFFVFFLQLKHL